MAQLTEEQSKDLRQAILEGGQTPTLEPEFEPELEPEEDFSDAREQQSQSWVSMVGRDWDINETTLAEQKEFVATEVAPIFEGIGAEIAQIFKNTVSAVKMNALEKNRFGIVGPSGGYWFPETMEERDKWSQQTDIEVQQILEEVRLGTKKIEDLSPKNLNTIQQGGRAALISVATLAPGMLASILLKNPTPAFLSMGMLTGADSYTTGRAEGLTHKEAMVYGGADAIIEVATEIIPARAFLRLFPGAKDAAGSFSKRALKYLIAEMGGEQAATWLQNINAYKFDLDKEMLAIEQAYEYGVIDGLEKEEKIRELTNQRIAITAVAVFVASGLMTGVAKMVDYGMSDEEIEETLGSQMTEQLFLSPEFEALEKNFETDQKITVGLAQTGAAQSAAVQSLNDLEEEKQSLLADPKLKKDTKKLKVAVDKIDSEIATVQAKIDRIEQTRSEFEKIDERLKRLREIDEELSYTEDPVIITELEQEQDQILSEIKMEGPPTAAPQPAPIEYTPYEPEEGVIVLEDTPEAKKQAGKTGFFNSTVQKLYNELIGPRTGERIVTAYNAIRQKMADSGYTSEGTIDPKAPFLLKQMQKDLRRLLRLSKNLLNKRLAIRRLQNKLAEGTIEETEYDKKTLEANQAITETEANIEKIIERSQEPLIPMRERVENMNDPYGKNSRFFAPKSLWKTIKETIIPYAFDNSVIYRPTVEDAPLKEMPLEELEGETEPRPQIAFKDIPEDAKIRLYFYDLSSGTMEELRDPITGKIFWAEYDGFEFVNPLSGEVDQITGRHKLDESLLPSIEIDGKTYQALWEPGTKSKALVNLWNNPAMDPNKLSLLPKTLDKEDRKKWTAAYYHRFKSFITPAGPRPGIMEELQSGPGGPIAKGKLSERQISRLFKNFAVLQENLAKDIEKGIIKMEAEINDEGVYFQGGDKVFLDPITTMDRFKELIAKSFRGNKDAQKELRRLGQTELAEEIVKARKRISKNSRRIIELVKLIDPEGTYYTKEKIKLLEDSVERYMGRIFAAYVFPDWRPPNRLTASRREQALHEAAVSELAEIYGEKEGISQAEAVTQAENDLDILYQGTGQQRAELYIRMFEFNPAYLTTDTSQLTLVTPQLKQKRTDIPKKVREALGELDQSWAQAQMTAYKQEQFIAVTEYLMDVAKIGNSPTTRFLSLVPTARYNKQITIPGDVLNPLNEYWTTPEMARAIMKTMGYGPLSRYLNEMNLSDPQKQVYLAAQATTGWISLAYLTLSIRTQSRNFQSAMWFPLMSGNWEAYMNPKEAAIYIKEKISGMSTEELDFIVGEGVTSSSVNIGERRALFDRMQSSATWQDFYSYVEEMEGQKINNIKGKWRKLLYVTEEAYILADDIPKIMNYLGEKDSGYKIFAPQGVKNLTNEQIEARIDMISEMMIEMGGQKVSRSKSTPAENLDKAIRQRASFLTRRNIPNYNRLPNVVDFLRFIFLSNFSGFPTAIMVSEANIIKTAMVESNLSLSNDPAVTPGLKSRLRQRAATRATANIGWAFRGTVQTTASGLWFASKAAIIAGVPYSVAVALGPQALSYFVAPWAGNHDFIIVSDADEEGLFYVLDVSYSDGYTLVSDPGRLLLKYLAARQYMGKEAADKVWDTMMRSILDLRGTYTDSKIMLKVMQEVWTGKNSDTGADLWDPELPALGWKKMKARVDHMFKELSPRAIHETIDIGKSLVLTGEEALDKKDQERSILKALAQAGGFKLEGIEPKQVIGDYKLSEFNGRFRASDAFAKDVFRRAEGSELGYDDMPAMIAAYDELQRQHLEQVKDLRLGIHWWAPLRQTSSQKVVEYLQKEGRDTSVSKRDRANLYIDRKEKPLYEPTAVHNFVNAYHEALTKLQKKYPDLTDLEIGRRVATLEDRVNKSHAKWKKEPVYWTLRGVIDRDKVEISPSATGKKLSEVEKRELQEALGLITKD